MELKLYVNNTQRLGRGTRVVMYVSDTQSMGRGTRVVCEQYTETGAWDSSCM